MFLIFIGFPASNFSQETDKNRQKAKQNPGLFSNTVNFFRFKLNFIYELVLFSE